VAGVPVIRGSVMLLLAVIWPVVGPVFAGQSGFTALSAAVLAAVLAGLIVTVLADSARLVRAITSGPLVRRAAGLREKSWCAAFLRQRDPDAAGRARPRAPSVAPAAA
jgi:Family of unknown function (DUF6412)